MGTNYLVKRLLRTTVIKLDKHRAAVSQAVAHPGNSHQRKSQDWLHQRARTKAVATLPDKLWLLAYELVGEVGKHGLFRQLSGPLLTLLSILSWPLRRQDRTAPSLGYLGGINLGQTAKTHAAAQPGLPPGLWLSPTELHFPM